MAYNDKILKTDLEEKPIPQAYNPDIDDYEPVHSTNNALNQVIYGPNGQPISTVGNKLAVRATELEALMQGFATEGKLEQVRQQLEPIATNQELTAVKNELALVKAELQAVKTAMTDGNQKVQLSGYIVEIASMNLADRPAYTTITQPTSFTLLAEKLRTWVTDGSADWVEVDIWDS